jgi:drug/metabolite transporter (DMT)-like permease
MRSKNTLGILAGLTAASIWGGMYVVSKVVLEVIPPFGLLVLRLILGLLSLGIIVAWRNDAKLSPKQKLSVVGIGVIGYGISLAFQFLGTKLSTAANGAVVTSTTPAFVFIFAYWILGEEFSKRRIGALILSTIGVIAVIDPRGARLSRDLFWGNLSLVAAAFTWALYSVLIRKATRNLDALPVTFVALMGGLLIAIPAGMWEFTQQAWGNVTLGIVAGVLYLGIISTALAAYLWNKAFEILEAGAASLTFFAQPVFGAVLGVTLLGEQLTPGLFLGGVMIGLGLWLGATMNSAAQGD